MDGRRSFLRALANLPVVGGLFSATAAPRRAAARDYFAELGVRPFINAAGTYTALTASLMPPEVVAAIEYGSRQYVHLDRLQEAVGNRLATLIGVEAAMVTSGAAGALTVGTAACITGKDRDKILRIPDLTGMKTECLVQKTHRYGYDHAVRATGVKMVEIETAAELRAKAGPQTAVMLFFNDADQRGAIPAADWVRLGNELGIPTFNDAAADVPPVENLSKYSKLGFDLVTFSGGKGLRGPQSAGLLLGRRDLIEAARLNTSPHSDSLARGMKVNKEEMLGMLAAVELYLKKDHAAEWKEWERRVNHIAAAARKFPSVQAEVFVPPIANHVPHLRLTWDEAKLKLSPLQAVAQLREGTPSIEPTPLSGRKQLVFGVWMMQPGDAEQVARRLTQIFRAAV
jgi:L-seryl-tRNA(Ser) seleniumtransferase